MQKVRNRKVINCLSWKSFQANRGRNIIAVMAIVLTTILFTTLFTIGLGTIENFQRQTMRQAGGDSHGVIKNITPEQYQKLSQHPLVKYSADNMVVAEYVRNPEFLKRHVEIWYYPVQHYEHCFIKLLDGTIPQQADEILLDEVSMELLGLEPKAGQQVTLDLQIKNDDTEVIARTFTVTGVIASDPAMDVGFAIVTKAYQEKYASELRYTYDQDFSAVGAIRMDVDFANSFGIQQKLERVIDESGYSTVEGEKGYIGCNANWAYVSDGAGSDVMTTGALAGGLLLILVTGYLIIYNIFRISVMRDIRYYGLLKTIGTTKRQIKRILRKQALLLGIIGTPVGLLLGFWIGKAIVPLVLKNTSYDVQEVVVSMNPLIFIGAAIFSLVTVFISISRPARLAARTSPIEAVRYTEGTQTKKAGKKSTDGGKIWRMAFSNLGRSKGRTMLVVASLSLAVILLNSVFTVTRSFDMDRFLAKFVTTDFLIANASYFNQTKFFGSSEEYAEAESLSETFISACEAQDGFETGGRIYGTMNTIGLKKDSWAAPGNAPHNEKGEYGNYWNGVFYPHFELEDGSYGTGFYGLEDFLIDHLEVWKGETDLEVIKEKLDSGDYILSAVELDDNGKVIEETMKHQPGDKITLTYGDGQERTFEVLAVVKNNSYAMTNRVSEDFLYYTSAKTFKEISSAKFLMSYAFDAQDDKEAQIGRFLKQYTTNQEPLMNYESKQIYVDQFSQLTGLFLVIGGTLAVIIGLIGILNFINSILTSMITRRVEFAMMEAIGMTRRQLRAMLMLEGVYYAVLTILFSLVFGCMVSVTGVKALAGGLWFMRYHFVMFPMLLLYPVLLLLGALVPAIAYRWSGKESICARIRANE